MKCRVSNELSREPEWKTRIHAFPLHAGLPLNSGAASLSHAFNFTFRNTRSITLPFTHQTSSQWPPLPKTISTSLSYATPSPAPVSPHPNPPTSASVPSSTRPPRIPRSSPRATRSKAPATPTPSKPVFSNSPPRTPSPLPPMAKQKTVSGPSCLRMWCCTRRWSRATSGLRGT